MRDTKMLKLTFCSMCIVINILGGMIAHTIRIPLLFLDTVGTILSAAVLGPFYGMATGGLSSILKALVMNPKGMPFALVNVAIGLTVGIMAKKFGFNIKTAIISGILLAVICPLIGTPIAVFLSGGFVGDPLDIIVAWMAKSGQSIFVSAFIPRVMANLIDKTMSGLLVVTLIKSMPNKILKPLKA